VSRLFRNGNKLLRTRCRPRALLLATSRDLPRRKGAKRTHNSRVLDILDTAVLLVTIPCRLASEAALTDERRHFAGSNRVRKIAAPQLLQRLSFY